MTVTAVDVLDSSDTLLLSLVGQHGTKGDVSDALDVRDRRVELRVDHDPAAVVDFDADLVEVEALGVRTTTNRDEDNVGLDLLMACAGVSMRGQSLFPTADQTWERMKVFSERAGDSRSTSCRSWHPLPRGGPCRPSCSRRGPWC